MESENILVICKSFGGLVGSLSPADQQLFIWCPFPQPLSLFDVQFLNAVGDLLDLIPALVPSSKQRLGDFKLPGMGHCSALIKVRGSVSFEQNQTYRLFMLSLSSGFRF